MTARYTGSRYLGKNTRIAEIYFTMKEEEAICKMTELMSYRGWQIEGFCCDTKQGSACCLVDSREDFDLFMSDWKECKELIRKEGQQCR